MAGRVAGDGRVTLAGRCASRARAGPGLVWFSLGLVGAGTRPGWRGGRRGSGGGGEGQGQWDGDTV